MTEPADEVVIDAAFFENILETDLANIVKKASSGQPLNKREREMIEEERTRRLQKSQPAFKLEGEGQTSRLEGMTQQQLAEEWGYSARTIKGWLAEGRAKNDPCPLKRPEEMLVWFSRMHVGREVPEKLRDAVKRIISANECQNITAVEAIAKPPVERIEIPEEQRGLLAMLNRYRDAEATLHAKYMTAIDAGDENKAGFYMREWSAMGEKLRALEKAAPKALEEMGIYVRKDDVMRELEPLHRSIPKSFRQRFRLARVKLLTLAQAGPEEWNREIDKIVEDVCGVLVESDFREPLELEVA